jgi:hypothetical protein
VEPTPSSTSLPKMCCGAYQCVCSFLQAPLSLRASNYPPVHCKTLGRLILQPSRGNACASVAQGVTEANYRQLMSGVGCLADLAELSQAKLQRLMGGEAAAKKLHVWLHANVPTLTAA